MFVTVKPFLSISNKSKDSITIGYYSQHKLVISGEPSYLESEFNNLKKGIEISEEEITNSRDFLFDRLRVLGLLDFYQRKQDYNSSRTRSFYSLLSNEPKLAEDNISSQTAVIIGCGGLGSRLAVELAGCGFQNFILIDDDTLESSNLGRLPWFKKSDLGEYKTILTKNLLIDRHPEIHIETYEMKFGEFQKIGLFEQNHFCFISADDDNGFFMTNNENNLSQIGCPIIFCGYSEAYAFAGPIITDWDTEITSLSSNDSHLGQDIIAPSVGFINSLITGVVITEVLKYIVSGQTNLLGCKWVYNILSGQSLIANT